MFAINVFGSFYCAREAVRRMTTKPGAAGRPAGTPAARSSTSRRPRPSSARRASTSTTRPPRARSRPSRIGLAKELAAEGIRVNAVRPGIIETEIHASGGTPDRVAQMAPQLPMQRAGTAEEVAEAIVWLLSDAAELHHRLDPRRHRRALSARRCRRAGSSASLDDHRHQPERLAHPRRRPLGFGAAR